MATRKRQWQVVVGVLIGVVVVGTAQGARALLDDSPDGFVPPDKATLNCENGVANSLSKFWACAEKCHIKAAAAGLAGNTSFVEEACEKTDPKSCLAQYTASVAKLTGCPACLTDPNGPGLDGLALQAEIGFDHSALFCAGTVPPVPLVGEDLGNVPPDKATLKCETGVANSLSKFYACAQKCHMKAAAAALAGNTSFDDEACEKTDPAKSCMAQYTASVTKLTGCPACLTDPNLGPGLDGLGLEAEISLDRGRGAIYCFGIVPF
jgi:hypothetical protein